MKIDDLDEFCRALPGQPPRVGVIRQAVRELIERTIATDAETRRRFYAIKRQDEKGSARGLRVVK